MCVCVCVYGGGGGGQEGWRSRVPTRTSLSNDHWRELSSPTSAGPTTYSRTTWATHWATCHARRRGTACNSPSVLSSEGALPLASAADNAGGEAGSTAVAGRVPLAQRSSRRTGAGHMGSASRGSSSARAVWETCSRTRTFTSRELRCAITAVAAVSIGPCSSSTCDTTNHRMCVTCWSAMSRSITTPADNKMGREKVG